jgi:recombination protein RecT
MNNAVATQAQRPKFSVMISTPGYQKMINNTLRDPKKAQRFVASITSAVATNRPPGVRPATIFRRSAGREPELSPSPSWGKLPCPVQK